MASRRRFASAAFRAVRKAVLPQRANRPLAGLHLRSLTGGKLLRRQQPFHHRRRNAGKQRYFGTDSNDEGAVG